MGIIKKQFKVSVVASALLVASVLVGCGGGGGGGTTTSSGGTITGTAVKGPLSNATVTLGTYTATTNSSGQYEIKYTGTISATSITVANGWDSEYSKTISSMSAPYSSTDTSIIITPITTMIDELVKNGNVSEAVAKTRVATLLGVSESDLEKNQNETTAIFGEANAIALVAFESGLSISDLAKQMASNINGTNSLNTVFDNLSVLSNDQKAQVKAIYTVVKDVGIATTENSKLLVSAIKTVTEDIKSNVNESNYGSFTSTTYTTKYNNTKQVLETLVSSGDINLATQDVDVSTLSNLVNDLVSASADLTASTAIKTVMTNNSYTVAQTAKTSTQIADELALVQKLQTARTSLQSTMSTTFASAVSSDVTLPTTGSDNTTISWKVVSGTGINASGKLSKTSSVQTAKLQATISISGTTQTETLLVDVSVGADTTLVLADIAKDKDTLSSLINLQIENPIDTNLVLSTTGDNGTTISWSIVSGSGLNSGGVISQTSSAQTAVLRATISKLSQSDTVDFTVNIKATTTTVDYTSDVANAKTSLTTQMQTTLASPLSANITLPTSGSDGTTISWSVASGSGITKAGVVSQTKSAQTAVLQALISKGSGNTLVTSTADFTVNIAGDDTLLSTSLNSKGYYEEVFTYDGTTDTKIIVNLPKGTYDIYAERTTSNSSIAPQISTTITTGGTAVASSYITGNGLVKDTSPAMVSITNPDNTVKAYTISVHTINATGTKASGSGWFAVVDRDSSTTYPKGGTLAIGADSNNTALVLSGGETHSWTVAPTTTGTYTLSVTSDYAEYKNPLQKYSVEIVENGNAKVVATKGTTNGTVSVSSVSLDATKTYNLKVQSYINYKDFLGYYTIKLTQNQ